MNKFKIISLAILKFIFKNIIFKYKGFILGCVCTCAIIFYYGIGQKTVYIEKVVNSPTLKNNIAQKKQNSNSITSNSYNYMTDKRWHMHYVKSQVAIEARNNRYGVAKIVGETPKTFKLGQRNTVEDIEIVVRNTYKKLPHIKTTDNNVKLMVETIIAESDGGRILTTVYKNGKDSGDYGLAQSRINVTQEILDWTKYLHKDVYEALMKLYDNNKSLKDNLLYNIEFGVAIGICEYWRAYPDYIFDENINTRLKRASIWKSRYNTYRGLGDVRSFISRNNYYYNHYSTKNKEENKDKKILTASSN